MGFALFKERRFSVRRQLTGLLPGKLIIRDSGQEFVCQPKNISQHGLGVVSDQLIDPGTVLVLQTRIGDIELEVTWRQAHFAKRETHRYGLTCLDSDVNMEEVFSSCSCLK